MPFIRVRDKDTKHEYDAPVGEVEANPGLYEVLDDVAVHAPREQKYFVPAKSTAKASKKVE